MKKGFISGLLLGIICIFSIVYASETVVKIKSSEYNNSAVFYNGKEIDLNGKNLISVINESEYNITNYMPLRTVVESLGYGVAWNREENGTQKISIYNEEYLIKSDGWVNYQEAMEMLAYYNPARTEYTSNRFLYREEARAVNFTFDARHDWDLRTAVINNNVNTIYVNKGDLNHCLDNLLNLPMIDKYTEEYLEKLYEDYSDIVLKFISVANVQKIIDENGFANRLKVVYNPNQTNSFGIYVTYNGKSVAILEEHNLYGQGICVKKDDINYYFREYGLPEIK